MAGSILIYKRVLPNYDSWDTAYKFVYVDPMNDRSFYHY